MDALFLKEQISKGENLHTEFKEILPDRESLARSIVCFANTDGGDLILGVTDRGEIVGTGDLDQAMLIIDDVAFQRCAPPITILQEAIQVEGKTVLVVRIPKGSQRPYRTQSGQYYIRSANRCRQASREELLRLFQSSESIYFDETLVANCTYNDLDMSKFGEFLFEYFQLKIHESDVKVYLRNLHLVGSQDKPTLTGLLFFGKKPQEFLHYAKVICAYIKGKDIAIPPFDKKEITGRIPEILEDTQRFLKLYLVEEHKIEDFKPEVHLSVPPAVLREAVVNAIAHRDYTITSAIRVFIYQDRVEVRTPGKLPNTVTIESMKIGGSHVLRNPTIYNLLAKMGMVTDLGSGVRRMMTLVREHSHQEVELVETENEFVVKVPFVLPA